MSMAVAKGTQQVKIFGGCVRWRRRVAVLLFQAKILWRSLIRCRVHIQIGLGGAGRTGACGRQAGGQVE